MKVLCHDSKIKQIISSNQFYEDLIKLLLHESNLSCRECLVDFVIFISQDREKEEVLVPINFFLKIFRQDQEGTIRLKCLHSIINLSSNTNNLEVMGLEILGLVPFLLSLIEIREFSQEIRECALLVIKNLSQINKNKVIMMKPIYKLFDKLLEVIKLERGYAALIISDIIYILAKNSQNMISIIGVLSNFIRDFLGYVREYSLKLLERFYRENKDLDLTINRLLDNLVLILKEDKEKTNLLGCLSLIKITLSERTNRKLFGSEVFINIFTKFINRHSGNIKYQSLIIIKILSIENENKIRMLSTSLGLCQMLIDNIIVNML